MFIDAEKFLLVKNFPKGAQKGAFLTCLFKFACGAAGRPNERVFIQNPPLPLTPSRKA